MDDARVLAVDDGGRSIAPQLEDRLKEFLHEIRQPVATVLALAEAARGLPGRSPEIERYLDRIVGEVQEVSSAAWSVLADVGDPSDSSTEDLGEVLGSVLDAFAVTWSGTLVRRSTEAPLWTAGSRTALRRCLVNVVDNAIRAAGPDGTVVVSTYGAGEILVVVEDDGPGFGRVPTHNGIGLRVARRVLAALGGSLAVGRSTELGGACVTLRLPLGSILAVPLPRAADHYRLAGPEH